MRNLVFILFLLASAIGCHAQRSLEGKLPDYDTEGFKDTVWIVTGKKYLGENFRKWKLDFVLDARKTLVSNTQASLGGIRVGAEYRRVHRFGIGVYGLSKDVHTNSLIEVDSSITEANLKMSYASIFYERVLYFHPRWEWNVALHQGLGRIKGNYRYEEGKWVEYKDTVIRPIEISTTGYFNVTWWCSLGAGVGYRYLGTSPKEVSDIFSAPVAIARVRIKVGKLGRSIWDKNVKYEY